jgi:hypothetical protein
VRPQQRKQDNIADRWRVGEKYHESVDADAPPAAGGMPYSSART